nr:hypothetical protein [uncultured Blautia sp.]
MKEKVKKVLVWIFEFVLFCGYFYVLFVNLVCGFGYGGISSRGQAIKILCASFFLAVGLPGLIWYQQRRLMKLENLLHDLFEIRLPQSHWL